jgi:hypothetical protein
MDRRINQLSQILRKMRVRYGSDDPVVLQLKESLEQFNAVESLPLEATLPFGERRAARANPTYWSVDLRHAHQPMRRRDVLAQCKRVEHRVLHA